VSDPGAPALAVRCPAKVNLNLRVLGRRPDGYHELDTVFQAVDLWDRIEIRAAGELSVTCDDPGLPVDGTNLVLRAARALADRCGCRAHGELRLAKSIPSQAGLGGGSSDAAGTLRLCSRYWGLDPDEGLLHELARELGADVPFFLVGGTAHGAGRGDRITALAPLPETALLLGFPPFGVPTAEVFRLLATRLTHPADGVRVRRHFSHKLPQGKDLVGVNDLEAVVFELRPELGRFRDALLEAGARRALLSGSGSTVYGVFEAEGSAVRAAATLRGGFREWSLLPTRTVSDGIRWAGES
jgi:4-diphosphocytidyl-2-C-methyl-D-erythritol kinase